MSLERKMGAREIVVEAGMSAGPGFYSGRGAIASDLNDGILEKVYGAVEREHGEEAAQQFAQMVADIPKLSATDFLLTLYRLEGHGWNWDKSLLGNERGSYPEDEGSAWGTVLSVLGGMGKIDETPYIRREFLRRHGIETEETRNCSYSGW